MALTKRKLSKWLLEHSFEELSGKKTSHQQYQHKPSNVVVTIPSHGRLEFSKKHVGMLVRQLEKAGFDKDQVRRELTS